jgi:hypothetical protein
MNRSERRAASRKTKGSSGVSVTFGRTPDPYYSPALDYVGKICKQEDKKKVLRSKQVPGY